MSKAHPSKKSIKKAIKRCLGLREVWDIQRYLAMILGSDKECRTAIDLGCGYRSILSAYRPLLKTTGVEIFEESLEKAKKMQQHDHYIHSGILDLDIEKAITLNGGKFDLVTAVEVIEHMPKKDGYKLLEICEQLTQKYILITTPNGFLEQGPEYGNEYQRHLSGWFPHDFEGLGYKVYGWVGMKSMTGYAGRLKSNSLFYRGVNSILSSLLNINERPQFAFSLIAIKDVRGAPARLEGSDDFQYNMPENALLVSR
jgi:hypothetical protein